MKHYFSTSSLLFLLFISINILSSCRDQNYDWNAAKKDQRVEQYEESFKSIFGDIDPQQSWDFSTCGNESVTRAASFANGTTVPVRTELNSFSVSDYSKNYPSPSLDGLGPNVFNSILDNFPNPSNLQYLTLKVKGPLCICPYWHSQFSNEYYIVIEYLNDDETVNNNYRYILTNNEYVAAINTPNKVKTWNNQYQLTHSDYNNSNGGNKGYVLSFPTTNNEHIVKIYSVEKNANKYYKREGLIGNDNLNKQISSTNVYSGSIFFDTDGDDDWNDMVCLFAKIATTSTSDTPADFPGFDQKSESKRYMVEDLGATAQSDIDFNDIVVDFDLFNHMEYNTNNKMYEVTKSNLAIYIYALGGTLDFSLNVGGNEIFKKSTGSTNYSVTYNTSMVSRFNVKTMYNTGSAEDGIIPTDKLHYDKWLCKIEGANSGTSATNLIGWIPSGTGANNISVVVNSNTYNSVLTDGTYDSSTGRYEITFPNNGEVPAIIAFDVNKNWRLERDGITSIECKKGGQYNWFTSTDPRK